jgi:hypothetical protein
MNKAMPVKMKHSPALNIIARFPGTILCRDCRLNNHPVTTEPPIKIESKPAMTMNDFNFGRDFITEDCA